MLRAASTISFVSALLLAALAAGWLAVVLRLELATGYEHDPRVASPSPDLAGVIVAVVLVALSYIVPPVLLSRSMRRFRPRTTIVFAEPTSYRLAAPAVARVLDDVAWQAGRESRSRSAMAAGLAALVVVALEGAYVAWTTWCFHCGRRSLVDANLYMGLACLAAAAHAVVELRRRREVRERGGVDSIAVARA